MKRWALIKAGKVSNVVEQDSQPAIPGDWVEVVGHFGPGDSYSNGTFSRNEPVVAKHVSVGAFKDRLGMDALAIAVSAHPVCVALREMLYDRKYVDLQRADVAAFLDMMIAAGQPEANVLFPGSGPMTAEKKAAILGAPIQDAEKP